MPYVEDRNWISTIWACYRRAKRANYYVRTSFWQCVAATIAVYLNRYDESLLPGEPEDAIAWIDTGFIHTDCGDGRSFDYLVSKGFRYAIGGDSTI